MPLGSILCKRLHTGLSTGFVNEKAADLEGIGLIQTFGNALAAASELDAPGGSRNTVTQGNRDTP